MATQQQIKSTDYALSCFETLEGLKQLVKRMSKTSPQFLKRAGDHYAKMSIRNTDGMFTKPNAKSHFDFHEYITFVATTSVVEHGTLVP